jgi:hypothetical protein
LKDASAALLALRGNGGRIRELEKERDGLLEEQQQVDEQMRRLEEVNSQIDMLSRKCEAIKAEEQQPTGTKRDALKIQIEDAGRKHKALETSRVEILERQKYLADIIFRQHEHEKTRQQEAMRRAEYIRQIEAESVQAGKELSESITMAEKSGENYAAKLSELLERQSEISKLLLAAEESHREKEIALSALQTEISEASESVDSSADHAGDIAKYRRNVLFAAVAVAVLLVIAIAGMISAAVLDRPQLMWTLMLISPAAGIFLLTYFAVARRRKTNMKQCVLLDQYSAKLEQCRRESFDAAGKEQDLRMQLENLRTQSEAVSQRAALEKEHYREKRDGLSTRIEALSVRLKNIRAEEQTASEVGTQEQNITRDKPDPMDPNEELAHISGEIGRIDAEVRESDALIRALLEEDKRLKTIEDAAGELMATCREEIAHLSGGREKIESHIPARSEIEEKILLVEERIERAHAYHRSLQIAGEAMRLASGDMERIFAPKVNELAGKYLSALTGGRYSSIRFDRDFHVEVATEDDVSYRNSDYFSGGTVDQIYLSLRLAISDLIHPEGDKMPLLLDDALVQYDDERAMRAVQLLVLLSAHRQIILFTCHKHTSERIRDAVGEDKKA